MKNHCTVLSGGNTFTKEDLKGSWREYRKKPVTVKAVQVVHPFTVRTLEGEMKGETNDFLIQGIDGELYPCKEDIFRRTYDIKHPQTQSDLQVNFLKRRKK